MTYCNSCQLQALDWVHDSILGEAETIEEAKQAIVAASVELVKLTIKNHTCKPAMREVKVFTLKRPQSSGVTSAYKKVADGTAFFHAWGTDYEECRDGVGSYSTAIIERHDGSIQNVAADLIDFI